MNVVCKLVSVVISAALCIGLLPSIALAHQDSIDEAQSASIADVVEGDQLLSSPRDDDALDDAPEAINGIEESPVSSVPSEDSFEHAVVTDDSARAVAMELSVGYGNLTTGSPSQFTLDASNPSSDMQYHLDWVQRYDYGVPTAVVDPSKMPAFQTSNVVEFEFCTSGRYELQFQVIDREPLASGQPARTAKKRITVDVTGAPSTEQLVQDIAASCSAAGMSTDYEKALWLHDYIVDKAE